MGNDGRFKIGHVMSKEIRIKISETLKSDIPLESRLKVRRKMKVLKQQDYAIKNKEKIKERQKINGHRYALKSDYNLTLDQYNKMFVMQEGKCLICTRHQSEFKFRLCVDHNHETLHIRGLLCRRCNSLLGLAKESVEIFKKAIEYLERTSLCLPYQS